ncbi:MAG: DUF2225 domain-containing protein [Cyclobacteriaceae bacterium]
MKNIHTYLRSYTRLLLTISAFLVIGICQLIAQESTDEFINHADIFSQEKEGYTIEEILDSLKTKLDEARLKKDTADILDKLIRVSYIQGNKAEYNESYDGYWEALILAENTQNRKAESNIYYGLGWLYSLYGRASISSDYFNKALRMQKSLNTLGEISSQPIIDIYYALASINRKFGNTQIARLYLDSCIVVRKLSSDDGNIPFIDAENGYLLIQEGRVNEAKRILERVESNFQTLDPTYLVILYPHLAKTNEFLGEYQKAEKLFLGAIEIANKFHSHLDLLPQIYEDLANLYVKMNNHRKAYELLSISKKLNEQQFGGRSVSNQGLLEIKDNYRIEKTKQDLLIQNQRLAQLEQESEIARLENFVLYSTIIFLVVLSFVIYRFLRTRYKAEKKLLSQQRRLEQEKAREVLEIKNKELTASAIQAIEREELLEEIKGELTLLKKNTDNKDVGRLVKNIDHRTSKSWEEFELRFTSVHDEFYKNLMSKFPKLSQNDHKLCALIKLNFSSKDMARLMGISIESVHTTRYRLRKKLGLERHENLEDFIAKKV